MLAGVEQMHEQQQEREARAKERVRGWKLMVRKIDDVELPIRLPEYDPAQIHGQEMLPGMMDWTFSYNTGSPMPPQEGVLPQMSPDLLHELRNGR